MGRGVFEALKFAGISEQAEMSTLGQQVCNGLSVGLFGCLVPAVRLFLMQPCSSMVYLPPVQWTLIPTHSISLTGVAASLHPFL